ncbi:MAG: regulatory protein RecX [Chitinophagales bacterium]|nr:regulatory protein RecX [Chitinophagales bacterium]
MQNRALALLEIERKIRHYCGYQERCEREVREKLGNWQLTKRQQDAIIDQLIDEGYLNEDRYLESFINGKLRQKHWGKLKIRSALSQKGIAPSKIDSALAAIDALEYEDIGYQMLLKKWRELDKTIVDDFELKGRLAQYLFAKGFEPDLVWKWIAAATKNPDLVGRG